MSLCPKLIGGWGEIGLWPGGTIESRNGLDSGRNLWAGEMVRLHWFLVEIEIELSIYPSPIFDEAVILRFVLPGSGANNLFDDQLDGALRV